MVETVRWTEKGLEILDQSLLPGRVSYEKLSTVEDVASAIKTLKVRGAPLIGVVAAFGLALAAFSSRGPAERLENELKEACRVLHSTRPTAVNLAWALRRMMGTYQANRLRPLEEIQEAMVNGALAILEADREANLAMGRLGQTCLDPRSRVLTVCNAGALATGGYGTALGVVRAAWAAGKLEKVWACETRPVLQGARLTVWELTQDGIPVVLLTDNMAGYLMHRGEVDAVITGADRIAANGDTANKIGTYSLAILARHHDIPFYVAAPVSTLDRSLENGAQIPIENREADEVRRLGAELVTVADVPVFNPAFDVTPAEFITAIITEQGIVRPPFDRGLRELGEREHGTK